MRTDLSIDSAKNTLQQLAASRLPSLTVSLSELRFTETGALQLPTGIALLSERASTQLAGYLKTSADAIPTDGDGAVVALVNARLAKTTERVCLRLVRTTDTLVVRAIVEPLRPTVGEVLLGAVLALVDDARAYGVERGANHLLLAARTGRRFDAGGAGHEHGLAVSLDERGVVLTFAAAFLPRTTAFALQMVHALRADASALDIAAALRRALDGESTFELQVRAAQTELPTRPGLMVEVFLDHPDVPPEYLRRVASRVLELDAPSRYDVVLAMLADAESLDAEARFAVAWRAGDLLFIDE